MKILVLNAGSSTQKSCLYEIGAALPSEPATPIWEAHTDGSKVKASTRAHSWESDLDLGSTSALEAMLKTIWTGPSAVLDSPAQIDAIGHRVVHGGLHYRECTPITPEVKSTIGELSELAPSHNPAALRGIEAIEHLLPGVPQFAVFDTAFHSTIPDYAATYPGPYSWLEQGIRRYGFHGINHAYCAGRTAQLLGSIPNSLITCHLGNGCSLAAIRDGRCVDTTMGFTPLEGLMMGSRTGSIDPGILLYLQRHGGYTADQLDDLLNRESGLKGLSGISHDLRDIERARQNGDHRAQLALDVYIHRLRFHLGAMIASLGGLEALVFTAGVGENSATVRAAACEAFAFLGIKLGEELNGQNLGDREISTDSSKVKVLIIAAQEDWAIAREVWLHRQAPA